MTITLTTPVQYQTFQRDGSDQSDIAISGTFGASGTPVSVEARYAGGVWTVIDASPDVDAYSGTLPAQPAGSGAVEVRWSDNTSDTASVADIRIGDVVLVVGQSNSVGQAAAPTVPPYSGAEGASQYSHNGVWGNLLPSSSSLVSTEACWTILANYWTAFTGFPVAFITAGVGGTDIDEWVPGQTRFDGAITLVNNSGVNGIACIIWAEGESDALNNASLQYYRGFSKAFRDGCIAQLPTPNAPQICAFCPTVSTGPQIQDPIRYAQLTLIGTENIYAGPEGYDQLFGDGLHWKSLDEMNTLADRYWAAIRDVLFSTGTGRGPVATDVSLAGNQITVTFDQPLQDPGEAYGAVAWTVSGSVVQSAAYSAPDKVVLTLDNSPSELPPVQYAKENTAAGAVVIPLGAAEFNLPADPFQWPMPNGSADYTLITAIHTGADLSAEQVFLCFNDWNVRDRRIVFGINNAGMLFVEGNSGGVDRRTMSDAALTPSTTYVVTYQFSNDAWTTRINGVQQSGSGVASIGITDVVFRDRTAIGAFYLSTVSEDYINSKIADIVLYDVPITDVAGREAIFMNKYGV